MDRKQLLLMLCEEIYDAVYYLYHEDSDMLKAHTGESLMQYGNVLSKIGWILTWGEEQEIEKMFEIIEDTFKKPMQLEWLNWKLQEIEEEINNRIQPTEELELNPEPQKQPEPQKEDMLPF